MPRTADQPLAVCQRRRARRLAYWNGAIWAIGNGLSSTTLVIYLAEQLDAPRIGLGISLILAARHVVGLLRLGTPALIGRLADRKRFCLGAYLLSALVLFGLPLAAAPGALPSAGASLAALVVLWCLYHLLEYLGTIALWSWLADLVPQRIRGRFIGQRERWMVAATAAAMLAVGLLNWWWQRHWPRPQWWIGYAIPAGLGACFMIAALVPLARLPRAETSRIVRRGATLRATLAPFADPRFLRLLLFGCWFSFFNGVTQSAQNLYPIRVLGISLLVSLAVQTGMRCGQVAVSPWLGGLADRCGNRPVMAASLLLVATGPLCYLAATPQQRWWFVAAWVVWIAYAGLNVGLPNLMLKLSPRNSNTPYIAAYYTVTGLCYAASTIAGGELLDRLRSAAFPIWGGAATLDYYQYCFLFGWATRSLGVLVLLLVIEGPDKKRGRESFSANRPGTVKVP
jgi:MFS family permease